MHRSLTSMNELETMWCVYYGAHILGRKRKALCRRQRRRRWRTIRRRKNSSNKLTMVTCHVSLCILLTTNKLRYMCLFFTETCFHTMCTENCEWYLSILKKVYWLTHNNTMAYCSCETCSKKNHMKKTFPFSCTFYVFFYSVTFFIRTWRTIYELHTFWRKENSPTIKWHLLPLFSFLELTANIMHTFFVVYCLRYCFERVRVAVQNRGGYMFSQTKMPIMLKWKNFLIKK